MQHIVCYTSVNEQTSETPTARSNISIAPSDKASDAHDIAAASATTQDISNANYLVGMPAFKRLDITVHLNVFSCSSHQSKVSR